MYSTSMPSAALYRLLVRSDNKSMPTPACISYLVGTGLFSSYFHTFHLTVGFNIDQYGRTKKEEQKNKTKTVYHTGVFSDRLVMDTLIKDEMEEHIHIW